MPTKNLLRVAPLLVCLAGAAAAAAADVYKVVDEQGRVTYTDSPPPAGKAEKLELPESNTLPPVTVTRRPPRPEQQGSVEYQLRIAFPPPDFHLTPGQRSLAVQLAVEPPLAPEHQLQVLDNGAPVEGSTLTNIVVRGEHILQARILDAQGRVLAESAPRSFFVHRPSAAP